MELTLYYMPKTRAFRVRWLLEELGLDYRLEHIDLYAGEGNTAEYRDVHPLGQVPALKVDNEVMFESGAMLQWLAETHLDKGLAPALDSPWRREFDQWMFFAVGTLEFPAWEILLHGNILPEDRAVKAIIPFATSRYEEVLGMLEQVMSGREYLVNDGFSVADIMMGYTLMWLPELLESHHALKAYTTRLSKRRAFRRASMH
jgi:glutathione S-transferase